MRWMCAAAALLGGTISVANDTARVLAPYTKPTLIAHRGASADAPEHTLAAYELALKQGADFIEPDLQVTKDGVLICLHDATLERTTDVALKFPARAKELKGRPVWPVADFTLAEIQTLDAGSWKGAKYAGSRVPTFHQMISLIKGKSGIIPELKASRMSDPAGQGMARLLMADLRKCGLDQPRADPKTPVIVQSFSADQLRFLRQDQQCRLPLVLLIDSDEISIEELKQVRDFANGVAPKKAAVLARPGIVKEAHALGLSVTVWTFRSGKTAPFKDVREEMAFFLRELGVDAVFTDNPDQFPRD